MALTLITAGLLCIEGERWRARFGSLRYVSLCQCLLNNCVCNEMILFLRLPEISKYALRRRHPLYYKTSVDISLSRTD